MKDFLLGFEYLQGVEVIGHNAGQMHVGGSGDEVARIENFIVDEYARSCPRVCPGVARTSMPSATLQGG